MDSRATTIPAERVAGGGWAAAGWFWFDFGSRARALP